ncbi:MAG: thiamine diphosphokinase [Bacillota bacterium]|nr:thiamine diphosphokinase [Bacillota bacterium]
MTWLIALGGCLRAPAALRQRLAQAAPCARVLAVDSGLLHLDTLGLSADILLGDFDSLPPERLASARTARILRYPSAKDESDGEIALRLALEGGARHILFIGSCDFSRPDHFLANLELLTAAKLQDPCLNLELTDGRSRFIPLVGPESIQLRHPQSDPLLPGAAVVSLLPVSQQLEGVSYTGLLWPLEAATLRRGLTRTLSNRPADAGGEFRINIEKGQALLVLTREEALS